MLKRWGLVGVAIVLVIVVGVGYAFLREPEQATGPISALPIQDTETTNDDEKAQDLNEPTLQDSEAVDDGGVVNFHIDPAQSEVRFMIDEMLRGEPDTVVGITDQVAGEITINPSDFGSTQLGTIQVNARTFATDSELRDRAIRNRILATNQFEFITFVPTKILNFPPNVNLGESFTLQIVGQLSIRNITREETFEVMITPISESTMEGFATTVILRSNYGLSIPSVPQVADVGEEILLEIAFVATA